MLLKSAIKFYLIPLLFCLLFSGNTLSQNIEKSTSKKKLPNWQVSVNIGAQMSGIKSQDFVSSNYSPLLNISVGKWFAPSLALQIGYRGWYFNTISDSEKHHYNYYFGEALFNINELVNKYSQAPNWNYYLHGGAGYFYNYDYEHPNICAHLGLANKYRITYNHQANLGISAIFGWDIYQGDEDILLNVYVGYTYLF